MSRLLSFLTVSAVVLSFASPGYGDVLVGYDFTGGTASKTSGALSSTDVLLGTFSNGTSSPAFSSGTGTLFARVTATGADSTDGDTLAEAIANDAYFSFTMTNDSGSSIDLDTLDFDYAFTNAHAASSYRMYLMSDVGGFADGNEIGFSEHSSGTSGDLVNNESFNISGLGPFASTDSIEFRFYITDANSTASRIHRLDNVVVNSVSAVPEPSSLAVVSLSVACIAFRRRKR